MLALEFELDTAAKNGKPVTERDHSQLAFSGQLALFWIPAPSLIRRVSVAPKRVRKTKAKEDTL
jgi:hypothetical protein